MNTLPPVRDDGTDGDGAVAEDRERYHLPRHAHIVVYDERERELITIYDCGAAQKPPSAQLLGNLVRVDADHEIRQEPTGYAVRMSEASVLERQAEDHWVIRGGQ